jgi:hypothetical protein
MTVVAIPFMNFCLPVSFRAVRLTADCMMFRAVFWDILTCKIIVDNNYTRQYIPEDNSEHDTRRRENLKSHTADCILDHSARWHCTAVELEMNQTL